MRKSGMIAIAGVLACLGTPATAQVRTVDPTQAIDQDLTTPRTTAARAATAARARSAQAANSAVDADAPTADRNRDQPSDAQAGQAQTSEAQPGETQADAPYRPSDPRPATRSSEPVSEQRADAARGADATFHRDDLIGAGEGVFGKGAQGFAGIIEKILKGQGEPNAYIAGREASGAFVVGLRYGSGVMTHKIEGQMPVYWTGPSVGFDVGGDANKVFVLVYNLYDSAELYHRFPQAEGHLYAVGGFSASYLRWGHVVVIPVRLGVGWRAGVNVGYMKFTRKSKWLPF